MYVADCCRSIRDVVFGYSTTESTLLYAAFYEILESLVRCSAPPVDIVSIEDFCFLYC